MFLDGTDCTDHQFGFLMLAAESTIKMQTLPVQTAYRITSSYQNQPHRKLG